MTIILHMGEVTEVVVDDASQFGAQAIHVAHGSFDSVTCPSDLEGLASIQSPSTPPLRFGRLVRCRMGGWAVAALRLSLSPSSQGRPIQRATY
jgi:hypothetical protein